MKEFTTTSSMNMGLYTKTKMTICDIWDNFAFDSRDPYCTTKTGYSLLNLSNRNKSKNPLNNKSKNEMWPTLFNIADEDRYSVSLEHLHYRRLYQFTCQGY